MKIIHWIIIGIATLGVAILIIYLVTKKPRKPKPGEIIKDPKTGKMVQVIKVDPKTGEPTIVKEPGKEPVVIEEPGLIQRFLKVGAWIKSPTTGESFQVMRVHPTTGLLLMVKRPGYAPVRTYMSKSGVWNF